jgi:hypothetical protein
MTGEESGDDAMAIPSVLFPPLPPNCNLPNLSTSMTTSG